MKKTEVRKSAKAQRAALTREEVSRLSEKIAQRILSSPYYKKAQTVHVFLPIVANNEPDTSSILHRIWADGKRAVASISNFSDGSMQNYEIFPDTVFVKTRYGIPEPKTHTDEVDPKEIDLVLTPLLAFDRKGNRVGYGKGFYDRFLSSCRTDVKIVGLSLLEPEDFIEDCRPEDIKLNACATADNFFVFPK